MNKLFITITAGLMALGTTVSAASLSISGGSVGTIPGGGTNNVLNELGLGPSLTGIYGSEIIASNFGANSSVRVEVIGFEATFLNSFDAGGDFFDTPGSTAVGDRKQIAPAGTSLASWTFDASGGLDFTFGTSGHSGGTANTITVANGSTNTEATTEVNFFAYDDGKYVWLFFDDRGSSSDDDNHDDLVVRLSAVPLPAGALLLLSGMGILALRRRKS